MDNPARYLKSEILKIALPALLAVILFVIAVFGIVLPVFEKTLMTQKKNMISALTESASDILDYYAQEAETGRISLAQAQNLAKIQIKALRYGPEHKDYFWINDIQPRIIMHPYRPDLDGRDVSDFADPEGKLLFKEFVRVVQSDGHGYVQYQWQWHDDPERIVPKISYVKLFKPWGWIIGTGVYLEDIRQELAAIVKDMLYIFLGILCVILVLSLYIIRTSFRQIKKQLTAEELLYSYQNHLEELVETRTADLKNAMSRIKILSGFLPICAACKKIRDDKGYWKQIESYIREHSEAEFSHGICPDCAKELYPGYKLSG